MAYAYNSARSISGIRESMNRLSKTVFQTQKSANNISKSLRESNERRQDAISTSNRTFRLRRESVRRREKEDLIEASQMTGSFKRVGKIASRSTKGFLGRIMDFVGTVLVGWAVLNLPRIAATADNLYKRLQKYFSTLNGFFGGTTEMLAGFRDSIGAVFTGISTFNIELFRKEFDAGMNRLIAGFQEMSRSTEQGVDLLRQDASQLMKSIGFDFPDFLSFLDPRNNQTRQQTQGGGQQQGQSIPSAQSGPLLNFVRSVEGNYGSTFDGGSLSDFNRKDEDITEMTIAELVQYQKDYLAHQAAKGVPENARSAAVGAYQILYPDQVAKELKIPLTTKFSAAVQDQMALYLITVKRGITLDMIKNNPNEAARRLAQEFAGSPVLAPTQGQSQQVQRGQSFYAGDPNNKANATPERLEETFDKVLKQGNISSNPNSLRTNTIAMAPPSSQSNTTVIIEPNSPPPAPMIQQQTVASAPPMLNTSGRSRGQLLDDLYNYKTMTT